MIHLNSYCHCLCALLRFTEALEPLERGLALVNKLGDDLALYRWPGSQVIIDDTRPGKLLVKLSFY